MFSHFTLVGLGGAIGAMLRHGTNMVTLRAFGPHFPWGTLCVNLFGSLAMGMLVALMVARGGSQELRLLLGVGVLGGFTTFSAFSLDVFNMIERGSIGIALAYVLASVIGGIGALWLAHSAL